MDAHRVSCGVAALRLIRSIGAVAIVACVLCATARTARADVSRAPLASVNARLASIAVAPTTAAPARTWPAFAPARSLSVAPPAASGVRALHLPAALVRLAQAERLLDIHTKSLHADFWGLLDHGRGCTIKITLHI
jgi:hypothetical protein